MTPELISSAPSAAEAAFYATRMCECEEDRAEAVGLLPEALGKFHDSRGAAQILVESGNPALMQVGMDHGLDMSEHLGALQANREKLETLIERIQDLTHDTGLSMH